MSLIAGYQCNGDTLDFSGNDRTATAIGSTFTTPGKVYAQAALHDGIDDRWTLPTTGISNVSQSFSYGGWNNFTNAMGSYEHMMGTGSTAGAFINKFFAYVRRNDDGRLEAAMGKAQVAGVIIRSTNVLMPDAATDYHTFVTYDGSETFAGWKFYCDGVEVTDRTEVGAFGFTPTAHDAWFLGNEESLTFDMAGKQNQMLLYDEEVSAATISGLHNGGAGVYLPAAAGNINRTLGRGLARGIGRGL